MKMTMAIPMPFHTSTMATDRSAMSGSVSHPGPSTPIASRATLIRPREGCMSTANVIPTATVLTRTGKKMIPRSSVLSRMLEVRSVASSRPMTTLRPLVTNA